MINHNLTNVALRYSAIYLDINRDDIDMSQEVTKPVLAFVAYLSRNGYIVSEELLRALCLVNDADLNEISKILSNRLFADSLNWAPLVKNWLVPTGESVIDHLVTCFANFVGEKNESKGVTLPCGHYIPDNTFPIEKYNGCPFCGTPFETSQVCFSGQGSNNRELRLFTANDLKNIHESLLTSPVPLDISQKDSLKMLLPIYGVPTGVEINMKETEMLVISELIDNDMIAETGRLMKTPTDVLRYLWYKHTGYTQIIKPKTLIARNRALHKHIYTPLDSRNEAAENAREKLKLKFDRKMCRRAASWLNGIKMSPERAAENMHPNRGMWVKMIHALRLGEFSRKKGYEHLARILDVFYNNHYEVWQGRLDKASQLNNADEVLSLLKQRPGTFARSLFATMLKFGPKKTLKAFNEISDQLPSRLLVSLGNAADSYFEGTEMRSIRTITGLHSTCAPNKFLQLYTPAQRDEMTKSIQEIFRASMSRRYAKQNSMGKTIYIDKALFDIPVSVGDRTTTLQDSSCALMGTRFPIEGDSVRLFMQWGNGLTARHLDMDLSCAIAYDNHIDECAFFSLTCTGAKHSGDIRYIPDLVGTAEYIELSIPELVAAGAKFVTFTCNAYSCGGLSPNLVVGWMNSAFPMQVSEQTGVAYDPSCVQHMVRINDNNLTKGLVFGVLDVQNREIIWVEMPISSQTVMGCDTKSVMAFIQRLKRKTSIGQLLKIKAKAQNLTIIDDIDKADETYNYQWALNPANVARLLLA